MVRRDSSKSVSNRISHMLRDKHRDLRKKLRERHIRHVVRSTRKPEKYKHVDKSWIDRERRNSLWDRVSRRVETIVMYPIRLIEHRYCHTSKATYVNIAHVIKYKLFDKVRGIYVAFHQKIDRFKRPMVRALKRVGEAIKRFILMLKKLTGSMLTKIVKVAIGWVKFKIHGWRVSPTEAAVRQTFVARLLMSEDGRREDIVTGKYKHCSVYAIVEGEVYKGLKSGWWFWHRRWILCTQHCSIYTNNIKRGVCQSVCNGILAVVEPKQLYYFGDKWKQYVDNIVINVPEV